MIVLRFAGLTSAIACRYWVDKTYLGTDVTFCYQIYRITS